jgi:hypothetical protein
LYDVYGGSMPSGWTRLVFENYEFPYTQVFPADLDAGGLREKFDVLVFNDTPLGGGGGRGGGGGAGGGGGRGGAFAGGAANAQAPASAAQGRGAGGRAGFTPEPVPQEFERRRGSVTPQTMAKIQEFVEQGGTVIGMGASANPLLAQFKLPFSNHLVEDGRELGREKYYAPGSILRVALDPKNPLAHGYGNELDIFFDNNPVWKADRAAGAPGVEARAVAWFPNATPLRSGWAWGQKYLDKGIEMVEANVGKGRVILFGNELIFRSQPYGSYKLFFNGLYLSVAPELRTQ